MAKRKSGSSQGAEPRVWFSNMTAGLASGAILLALPAVGTFLLGWFKFEKAADGGISIEQGESSPFRSAAAETPPQPEISLSSEGAQPESARLASTIEPLVQSRIRSGARLAGLRLNYRLANLGFAGGPNRQVVARWGIALPGKQGAACGPAEFVFYSAPDLAEQLAERIGRGIAVTEQRGEPACG